MPLICLLYTPGGDSRSLPPQSNPAPPPPTPRHTSHSGIFWKFGMKKNSKNWDFLGKKIKFGTSWAGIIVQFYKKANKNSLVWDFFWDKEKIGVNSKIPLKYQIFGTILPIEDDKNGPGQ